MGTTKVEKHEFKSMLTPEQHKAIERSEAREANEKVLAKKRAKLTAKVARLERQLLAARLELGEITPCMICGEYESPCSCERNMRSSCGKVE